MTTFALSAAGFGPEFLECRKAVRKDWEACSGHYVLTHLRDDLPPEGNLRECFTCGGQNDPNGDTCGRSQTVDVAA